MNAIRKLKISLAVTAALFLCGFIRAAVTHAATYWASPQGSHTVTCSAISGTSDPGRYGSFAGAVACAANSGDKVYVKPGTYTTNATIINPSSGITIQGSDPDRADWPVLRPSGSSARGVNFNNTSRSGIVFKYLQWDMSGSATAQNCINTSSDAIVSFILEDFECLGPPVGSANKTASGIKISDRTRATIRRGIVRRWHSAQSQPGAHGFYWNGSNGLVEHTEIASVNGYCLQFYWTAGSIRNNIFRNNTCRDATNQGGVYIQSNSSGNQVYDNIFCNVKIAIIDKTVGGLTTILNNANSAVSCPSSTSTTNPPGTPSNLQAVPQ
jgi:hypothetical protein